MSAMFIKTMLRMVFYAMKIGFVAGRMYRAAEGVDL